MSVSYIYTGIYLVVWVTVLTLVALHETGVL